MTEAEAYAANVALYGGLLVVSMLFMVNLIDGDRYGVVAAILAAANVWLAGNAAYRGAGWLYTAAMTGALVCVAVAFFCLLF